MSFDVVAVIVVFARQRFGRDELFKEFKQEEAGGKEPPWDDVFSALHQSTKQSGSFIDNKSKKVVENYKMEMISKYGTNRENHPSFDGAA